MRVGFTGVGRLKRPVTTRRRNAADKGQRPLPSPTQPALRSRDKSGLRIGHNSPLQYLRLLEELWEVIRSIGPPCWAYGVTAAALKGFDGYELSTPFNSWCRTTALLTESITSCIG